METDYKALFTLFYFFIFQGSGKIESAVLKNWQGGKKIKGVKGVFAVQQVGQGCYR